jgi:hypothetical protein
VRQLIEESPEAPSLEKKETDVSVLFADISGYTRLSSRLQPDDLAGLVERYFGAFLDEIVKHGGDVNETAGDGLMVIFHEGPHPRAAVDAARAIHRRAAEIGAELAARFEPVAMHVGVNTGLALLGATKIEGSAGTRWPHRRARRPIRRAPRRPGGSQKVLLRARSPALGGLPSTTWGPRGRTLDRSDEALRLRCVVYLTPPRAGVLCSGTGALMRHRIRSWNRRNNAWFSLDGLCAGAAAPGDAGAVLRRPRPARAEAQTTQKKELTVGRRRHRVQRSAHEHVIQRHPCLLQSFR